MAFSKSEIVKLLENRFTLEQVKAGLFQMSKDESLKSKFPNIDPNGDSFPEELVEPLMITLQTLVPILEEQKKKLLSASQVPEQTEQQVIDNAITTASNQLATYNVSPQVAAAVLRAVLPNDIANIMAIAQVRKRVIAITSQKANQDLWAGMIDESQAFTQYLQDIAGNNQIIDAMLANHGVTQADATPLLNKARQISDRTAINVQAFFSEVDAMQPQYKLASSEDATDQFDPYAFLLEVKQLGGSDA